MKDGSEPRIQLEMALLKATQPQADLSLQALMFRIDQLERRRAVAPGRAATPPAPAPRPAPKEAVRPPSPQSQPQPVGSVELEQIVSLWPAVAEAVAEENGMLSAALSAATPTALEGDRLTIAFPADAAFVKKKAEQGRDLVANAVRGITGQPLSLAFELSEAACPAGRTRHARPRAADRAAARRVRRGGSLRRTRRGEGLMGQPNLNQMMKQVQKMQADMAKAQEELKNEVVEASAGGGMVTVKISGELELKELTIDPEAVDPEDVEMLQDMVQAAVNEAIRSAQELAASKMNAAAGGLGGPGGLGGLGLPGL